jgi:hypothetical protein
MKTTLLANGILKIEAESSVEAYALKHWWENLGDLVSTNRSKASGIAVDFDLPTSHEAALPLSQIK